MHESIKKYSRNRDIPAIFSGLLEARDSLVSHWHVASYSTSDAWYPMTDKIPAVPQARAWEKRSMGILARWSSAYDAYLNIPGDNLTDKKKKGTAILRILKELGSTSMMLTRTTLDNQSSWDVFCPLFQKIVSLAEDIIEIDLKPSAAGPPPCIDMALVRPLFNVGSFSFLVRGIIQRPNIDFRVLQVTCRCRDPITRRRAISLLQRCNRTEGVWDSFLTFKAAQRVLVIEEAGLKEVNSCEDVPSWARLWNVSLLFSLTQWGVALTYSRFRSKYDLTKETIKEMVVY